MTEQELLAVAAAEAKAAAITFPEWVKRVRDPAYPWKTTHWGKAGIALDQLRALPAPPPAVLSLQRTIFWAKVTDDAVQHACRLTGWRHALSADPSIDEETGKPLFAPTVEQVNALKSSSAGVDAWGNQLQIGADTIEAFARRWALGRRIHQAENEPEAKTVAASYVIGNFTVEALGQYWQRFNELVRTGLMACTHEVYDGNPADDSTQGLPVSSFTLGVAMDKGVHYPLADLLAKTPAGARPGICIWHGAGLLPDEWELLRSL